MSGRLGQLSRGHFRFCMMAMVIVHWLDDRQIMNPSEWFEKSFLRSPFLFAWKWQSSETVQLVIWASSFFVTVGSIMLVFFRLFYLTKILYTCDVSLNTQKWGYVLFTHLPFFLKWYNFQPIDTWCIQQNIQTIGW